MDKKMQEKQKNTTQNCFQVNLFYVKCKKNENTRNLQGKIYRKMQKMRISPHFLQLIER